MPSSHTAASAPPATITSASPSMISRAASPIACTPGRAGRHRRMVRSLEAVFDREMPGGEVDQRRRDEERRQPPRLALMHQHDGLDRSSAGRRCRSRSSRRWRSGLPRSSGIQPESSTASVAATSARWMKRSIFFWSLTGIHSARSSPPSARVPGRHLARRSCTADPWCRRTGWRRYPNRRRSAAARHAPPRRPSGQAIPMPVTTTRRIAAILSADAAAQAAFCFSM